MQNHGINTGEKSRDLREGLRARADGECVGITSPDGDST